MPQARGWLQGSNNSSASCGLQIGSQTQRFAKCQALTQDGSNVQLLWTLAPAKQVCFSLMPAVNYPPKDTCMHAWQ